MYIAIQNILLLSPFKKNVDEIMSACAEYKTFTFREAVFIVTSTRREQFIDKDCIWRFKAVVDLVNKKCAELQSWV